MEREQITDTGKMSGQGGALGFEQSENLLKIRLPAELKEPMQQEAEKMGITLWILNIVLQRQAFQQYVRAS